MKFVDDAAKAYKAVVPNSTVTKDIDTLVSLDVTVGEWLMLSACMGVCISTLGGEGNVVNEIDELRDRLNKSVVKQTINPK